MFRLIFVFLLFLPTTIKASFLEARDLFEERKFKASFPLFTKSLGHYPDAHRYLEWLIQKKHVATQDLNDIQTQISEDKERFTSLSKEYAGFESSLVYLNLTSAKKVPNKKNKKIPKKERKKYRNSINTLKKSYHGIYLLKKLHAFSKEGNNSNVSIYFKEALPSYEEICLQNLFCAIPSHLKELDQSLFSPDIPPEISIYDFAKKIQNEKNLWQLKDYYSTYLLHSSYLGHLPAMKELLLSNIPLNPGTCNALLKVCPENIKKLHDIKTKIQNHISCGKISEAINDIMFCLSRKKNLSEPPSFFVDYLKSRLLLIEHQLFIQIAKNLQSERPSEHYIKRDMNALIKLLTSSNEERILKKILGIALSMKGKVDALLQTFLDDEFLQDKLLGLLNKNDINVSSALMELYALHESLGAKVLMHLFRAINDDPQSSEAYRASSGLMFAKFILDQLHNAAEDKNRPCYFTRSNLLEILEAISPFCARAQHFLCFLYSTNATYFGRDIQGFENADLFATQSQKFCQRYNKQFLATANETLKAEIKNYLADIYLLQIHESFSSIERINLEKFNLILKELEELGLKENYYSGNFLVACALYQHKDFDQAAKYSKRIIDSSHLLYKKSQALHMWSLFFGDFQLSDIMKIDQEKFNRYFSYEDLLTQSTFKNIFCINPLPDEDLKTILQAMRASKKEHTPHMHPLFCALEAFQRNKNFLSGIRFLKAIEEAFRSIPATHETSAAHTEILELLIDFRNEFNKLKKAQTFTTTPTSPLMEDKHKQTGEKISPKKKKLQRLERKIGRFLEAPKPTQKAFFKLMNQIADSDPKRAGSRVAFQNNTGIKKEKIVCHRSHKSGKGEKVGPAHRQNMKRTLESFWSSYQLTFKEHLNQNSDSL